MQLNRFTFLSILSGCVVSAAFASAFPGKAFGSEDMLDRHYMVGRQQSGRPLPPITLYHSNLAELIIGSTPLEQGDRWADHVEPTSVTFDVDASGHFSKWKLAHLSGSITRDFWTLYAVASCPSTKPLDGLSTPLTMKIDNVRVGLLANKDAENWRVEQGYGILRKLGAENIYFSLIPASFIRSFPGTVGLSDICAKQNLVGIPVNRLCTAGQKYWSLESANALIETNNQISEFLGEWSQFFKSNPHPSKGDIISFADGLKVKYKSLLKEGEPEAPLP